MTPPITPKKVPMEVEERIASQKEMVPPRAPPVKLPTFIPGNCNIEEIMRQCGATKNPDPGAEMQKRSEAV